MQNQQIHAYYEKVADRIKKPTELRNLALDSTTHDVALVRSLISANGEIQRMLDLGSGTGLLANGVSDLLEIIVCVEKYAEFSAFVERKPNIRIETCDLLEFKFQSSEKFNIVTLFGVMNFFDSIESAMIYG